MNIVTETEIKIDTQISHKDSIFDLILTDSLTFYVLVECKMGANIGKNISIGHDQLDKYIGHLKEFPIGSKYLMLIDVGELAIKEDLGVIYKAVRWKEVKIFLESQTGETEIGEFLRLGFLELLQHLKVDRILINGKLSWKCELCSSEMLGQGIFSHKKKHERDPQYCKLIDEENLKTKNVFDKIVSPHIEDIKRIKEKIKNIIKVEKANFKNSEEITELIQSYLPKNIWIYFINQIPYCFSNKAFADYRNEIIERLNLEKIEYLDEPKYLACTYENIIKLLDRQ